ncbi:MAG: metalloregulator ArsR/SmtB family transcription factor [Acidobacteriota bacterium]|nr:metalloregulator ArsR/SmtB family transcription factor [Acidobacteriota bacterium]
MTSIVKILRAAADPTRLRMLLLLKDEELSVAELQEVLAMGQSTISSHLSQLKQAGLAQDRRTGKNNLYRLSTENAAAIAAVIDSAKQQVPEAAADYAAMRRVVKKRQDRMRAFFDSMAGRLGKDYVPGKSWKSYAEAFLRLLPPMTIADLGAGDGGFALTLAQQAKKVIAVDSSEKMIEVGRDQAQRASISNIEFRLGDMEELPIDPASIDVAFFSQSLHHAAHPGRALAEAARILKPGGRVVVLDLLKHRFEEARELYADEWLGFGESELEQLLTTAGFTQIHVTQVDRQAEPPNFQTLLAVAQKQTV